MILKIRKDGGWAIFDNISKFNMQYPNKSPFRVNGENGTVQVLAKSEAAPGNTWHDVVCDHIYMTSHSALEQDGFISSYSAMVTRGTTTELFLFSEGYLMNDEGSTIERFS